MASGTKRSLLLQAETETTAAPEAVLALVATPRTWPRWQPEILSTSGPEQVTSGDSVDGEAKLLGFAVTGQSRIMEVSDDGLVEDVIVGVRMKVSYEVTPVTGGSRITRRLEATLPGGLAGRVLSIFLAWRLKKMQQGVIEHLARQAEVSPFA